MTDTFTFIWYMCAWSYLYISMCIYICITAQSYPPSDVLDQFFHVENPFVLLFDNPAQD